MSIARHTMKLTALDAPLDEPPARIQLLPSGCFTGRDGRGPYRIADMGALIEASQANGPLIVDECHATDLGAVSAPAFGRIAALFGDARGLFAEVQWNKRGHAALIEREPLTLAFTALGLEKFQAWMDARSQRQATA